MYRLFSPIFNPIYRDGLVHMKNLEAQPTDLYQLLYKTTSDQQIVVPARSAGPS